MDMGLDHGLSTFIIVNICLLSALLLQYEIIGKYHPVPFSGNVAFSYSQCIFDVIQAYIHNWTLPPGGMDP